MSMTKIDYQLVPVPIVFVILFSLVPIIAAQNARSPPPPQQFGFNGFNPSMAIIIVVLIAAFFFMGFFSIYVRRRSGAGSSVTVGPARSARSRRGANRGLDPVVLDTFPTFAYSEVKNLKLGKGTLECAVCLCEFEDEETLRLLPKCSHVFHPECIDMWLNSHVTCPVCRCNLSVPAAVNAEAAGDEADTVDIEAGDADLDQPHSEITSVQMGEANHEREQQETAVLPANVITPTPNRPPRSGSIRRPKLSAGRFPRSHSTGHSLVQPGENCERYTLRLPEHVRKQILQRTSSCVVCPSEGSIRRGHRIASESTSRGRMFGRSESGVGKSDRWMFSVPSFIPRSFSLKSVSLKRAGSGDVEQGTKFPTVNSCLGGAKADEEETASTRPQRSTTPVFTVATTPSH